MYGHTTRTRSKSDPDPTPPQTEQACDWTSWDGLGGEVVKPNYSYKATGDSGYDTTTMDDVVTPNYKKRSAAGEIINNDFYKQRDWLLAPTPVPLTRIYYNVNENGEKQGSKYEGTTCLSLDELGSFLDGGLTTSERDERETLISTTVTKAHANASAMELSVPMVAGEAAKSISSITSILRRVYKISKAAKQLDFAYLSKQITHKELADRYMELRYAIRPLVMDVEGTMNAWNESKDYRNERRTARAFGSMTVSRSDTIPCLWKDPWITGDINRSVRHDITVRAGVLADVRTSFTNVWGMDSILETAWELIPFSFIIDWFVNVGDTLGAWTPNVGVHELASWVTVTTKSSFTNSLTGVKSDWGTSNYDVASMSLGNCAKMRLVETTTRDASPQLSVWPQFTVNLNPLKLLDLAIISGKLR